MLSRQFVKEAKNYSHRRRTVQMFLLITIVFNLFSLFYCESFSFAVRRFLLGDFFFALRVFLFSLDFYFSREMFYFSVRLFIFLWNVFFFCNTFPFFVRLFISPWDHSFFSWDFFIFWEAISFFSETLNFFRENVSLENYFNQSENFWSAIKQGFSRLCSLCLVLGARHFCCVEK